MAKSRKELKALMKQVRSKKIKRGDSIESVAEAATRIATERARRTKLTAEKLHRRVTV